MAEFNPTETDYNLGELLQTPNTPENEKIKEFGKHDLNQNDKIYFVVTFFIGLLNNVGYVIVGIAAQDIADHFGKANLMPSFQLSLILFSSLIRVLNSSLLIKIKHTIRLFCTVSFDCIGYIIIAICLTTDNSWGFYVSLAGSIIAGWGSTLGDCTSLGFIKAFPPQIVAGWSSGTGFAGIVGTGSYLIVKTIGIPTFTVFIFLAVVIWAYWFLFLWLIRQKTKLNKNFNTSITEEETLKSESKVNTNLSNCKEVNQVLSKVWFFCINLGSVYYLEYCCTTGWADRSNPGTSTGGWIQKNAFVLLGFSYQTGVFISRSSIKWFVMKKIQIFTIIQLINFLIYMTVAIWNWLPAVYQIVLMVFVGLVGGSSYSNTYFSLYDDKKINHGEKELGVNCIGFSDDTGILLASVTFLIIDILWLPDNS